MYAMQQAVSDTCEMLGKQHLLEPDGERWRLHGLSIGGVVFKPSSVRVVEAGGTQDFRTVGQADQLRLGASFLSSNPCLWNFPTETLTFLKPGAAFLTRIIHWAESEANSSWVGLQADVSALPVGLEPEPQHQ